MIQGTQMEVPSGKTIHPGAPFFVRAILENDGRDLPDTAFMIALEINGIYYFWPEWQPFDPGVNDPDLVQVMDLPHGEKRIELISEFNWPAAIPIPAGTVWGAILDSTHTLVYGELWRKSWQ